MIPKISAEDLKKMQDREGLVLQGDAAAQCRNGKMASIKWLAEEKILIAKGWGYLHYSSRMGYTYDVMYRKSMWGV